MRIKFFIFVFTFISLFGIRKKDSRSRRYQYITLDALLKKVAFFDISSGRFKTIEGRKYVYSSKKGLYKLIGIK